MRTPMFVKAETAEEKRPDRIRAKAMAMKESDMMVRVQHAASVVDNDL